MALFTPSMAHVLLPLRRCFPAMIASTVSFSRAVCGSSSLFSHVFSPSSSLSGARNTSQLVDSSIARTVDYTELLLQLRNLSVLRQGVECATYVENINKEGLLTRMDLQTRATCLNLLTYAGSHTLTLSILQSWSEVDKPLLSLEFFHFLLFSLAHKPVTHRLEPSIHLLASTDPPSSSSFSSLSPSLSMISVEAGVAEVALYCLQVLQRLQISPTDSNIACIMKVVSRVKAADSLNKIERLWQDAHDYGISLSSYTYYAYMQACARAGAVDRVVSALEEAESRLSSSQIDRTFCWNQLLLSSCNAPVNKEGVLISPPTSPSLQLESPATRLSLAWRIGSVMKSSGVPSNAYTTNIILKLLKQTATHAVQPGQERLALRVALKLCWGMRDSALLDRVTLETGFDLCLTAGRPRLAVRVLQMLRKRGFHPPLPMFNRVLTYLAKKDLLPSCLHLLEQMKAHGPQPSSRSFSAVLAAAGRAPEIQPLNSLQNLMSECGVAHTLETYTTLLAAYGRLGQVDAARAVLSEMMKRRIVPDAHALNALLFGYAANLMRAREALPMCAEFVSMGLQPDVHTLNALLANFAASRQLDAALRVWGALQGQSPSNPFAKDALSCVLSANPGCAPNIHSYVQILRVCVAIPGTVKLALRVARDLLQTDLVPSANFFDALLRVCDRELPELVPALHGEMKSRGISPTPATVERTARYYIATGHLDEAERLLLTAVSTPSHTLFESLANAYAEAKRLESLNKLLAWMRQNRMPLGSLSLCDAD